MEEEAGGGAHPLFCLIHCFDTETLLVVRVWLVVKIASVHSLHTILTFRPFSLLVLGPYLMILRVYFLLCTQESFPGGTQRPILGASVKYGLAACKARALRIVYLHAWHSYNGINKTLID